MKRTWHRAEGCGSGRFGNAFGVVALVLVVTHAIIPIPRARSGECEISGGKLDLNVLYLYNEVDLDGWKPVFTEASKLLYNATEGNLQFGDINFFVACQPAKDKADLWIAAGNGGASAHRNGCGKTGRHVFLSNTHKRNDATARGQIGMVHELGHYVFNLADEYGGCVRVDNAGTPGAKIAPPAGRYMWPESLVTVTGGGDAFHCTQPGGGTACLMDAGTTVTGIFGRTELCTASNHIANRALNVLLSGETIAANRIVQNNQQCDNGSDCWTMVAAKLGLMDVPDPIETDDPPGHEDVTFNDIGEAARFVLCLDKSGSMSGVPIQVSKTAASCFVANARLPRTEFGRMVPGDEVGVIAFSSTASVVSSLDELTNSTDQMAVRAAIATISAGGVTSIGGGLRLSLDQLIGQGTPGCIEAVILLSDGQHNSGESPSSVVPDIVSRKAVVFSIGLGATADLSTLGSIAAATGGKVFFAVSAADLPPIFQEIQAIVTGAPVLDRIKRSLEEGASEDFQVFVDDSLGSVVFGITGSGFDVTITSPSNDVSDAMNQAPGVTYFQDGEVQMFTAQAPEPGFWSIGVTRSAKGAGDVRIAVTGGPTAGTLESVHVYADAPTEVDFNADPTEQLIVRVTVSEVSPIAGATVTAEVTRPDESVVSMSFVDNGDSMEQDGAANDGIYSSVFRGFIDGNGVYTFGIKVDTSSAVVCSSCEDDGGGGAVNPAPSAVRFVTTTTSVFGSIADCNGNGVSDADDIAFTTSQDCNSNGVPDECEISQSSSAPAGPYFCTGDCDPDCNENGIPDSCDVTDGSGDVNGNGVPDECELGITVVYSNEPISPTLSFNPFLGNFAADDFVLAAGSRDLVSYDLSVTGGGGAAFQVTVGLYNNNPCEGGTLIAGTERGIAGVPNNGSVQLLEETFDPPIALPDTVWMQVDFDANSAGWVVGEQAEAGFTENTFAWSDFGCITVSKGFYGGFAANIFVLGSGACCLPNGTCQDDVSKQDCEISQGGTFQGLLTTCGVSEACCLSDGTCEMLVPSCCDEAGGIAQGPGTTCTALEACCLPDESCALLDPLCCAEMGGVALGAGSACAVDRACCLPDGECKMLDPLCCIAAGGLSKRAGSACLGDVDGDGVDDACQCTIPAGIDCFETSTREFIISFADEPIPADFFEPGSLAFDGVLPLAANTGGIQITRLNDLDCSGPLPSIDATQVELNVLELLGNIPVFNPAEPAPTLWVVSARFDTTGILGAMTVTKTHANGGTFNMQYQIEPRYTFIFRRPGDNRIRQFIPGASITVQTLGEIPWVHQVSGGTSAFPCGENFVPGLEEDAMTGIQCCRKIALSGTGVFQQMTAPGCDPFCAGGACCDSAGGSCSFAGSAGRCAGIYFGDGTDCSDLDNDGLANIIEMPAGGLLPPGACNSGTNPMNNDTDGDGCLDGDETAQGTDPLSPCDSLPACATPPMTDCQPNGVEDECDVTAGDSLDTNGNDRPDECDLGACCVIASDGEPGCKNVSLAVCTQAGGDFPGIDIECPDQSVAFIEEPGGAIFVHRIGPPTVCPPPTKSLFGRAGCTPPFTDCWQSPANAVMVQSFDPTDGAMPIPAGFFGVGSDAFTGVIPLEGDSLGVPPCPEADTLIQRVSDPFDRCDLPSPTQVTVSIDVLMLSLKSIDSMVVTFNGGQNAEAWDVTIDLSPSGLPAGTPQSTLTATKTHCNGGSYTSILHVQPRFTFTKVGDPSMVVQFDTGIEGHDPITLDQTLPAPWVSDVEDQLPVEIDNCSDFHAGIDDATAQKKVDCDCDGGGVRDKCQIESGASQDCNDNGIPDECDVGVGGISFDCNQDGVPDECEFDNDCNLNAIPDECEIDENSAAPGGPFFCTVMCDPDCNNNGVPDECDPDCDGDSVPDVCVIDENSTAPGGPFFCTQGCELDCNDNGIPDGCEPDCNGNGIPDGCDVPPLGLSSDCNEDFIPDECEPDCNGNQVSDGCDILTGTSLDQDQDGIPDECVAPELVGACILPSGACQTPVSATNCVLLGGAYLGNGVDCPTIPTASEWSLIVMTLLLMVAGALVFGRPTAFGHRERTRFGQDSEVR